MAILWLENETGTTRNNQDYDAINAGSGTGSPFSTIRNGTNCTINTSKFHGTRQRNSSDHVDGLKVDLAKNLKVYRCDFYDNDICHLLLSYNFWGGGLPLESDTLTFEQCRFDVGHVSFGNPFYFHIQIQASAHPKTVVFKDCEFRVGPGVIGGAPDSVLNTIKFIKNGVTITNPNSSYPRVASGAAWPAYPGDSPPPPPPPPPPDPDPDPTPDPNPDYVTQDELDDVISGLVVRVAEAETAIHSLLSLQATVNALATKLDAKANKPAAVDTVGVKAVIDKIRKSNPNIAASDDAVLAALVKAVNELKA